MMTQNSQARYTDDDLLNPLETTIYDYGKRPSQRMILADVRLPTHHTFNARFGSIANALNILGYDEIGDNQAYHVVLGDLIKKIGGEILETRPKMGTTEKYIIADFKFSVAGHIFYVDLVGMMGISENLTTKNQGNRLSVASVHIQDMSNTSYIQVLDVHDIIYKLENLRYNE